MPDEDDNNLYNGERGPAWRKYRRDMLSTARGKFSKNDKYSFKQAMLGTDEGGVDPAAPAMPAAAAALSMAQQKRIVRHGEAYKFVYDSIGEERLKNMLDAIDDNHADGLAKAAWDLIIRECDDPGDELELTRLNILWTCASVMNTVGHSPSTIVDYHRELQTMNARHSRRHKTPPQSTWEAELSVMIATIKESIFAKNIGEDMKVKLETTHVLTDSKSAYDTVRNPGATEKSTHVERWLMFARDLYLTKAIGLTLVPTHRMMADGMTKVVDKDKFFKCRDYAMGIEEKW